MPMVTYLKGWIVTVKSESLPELEDGQCEDTTPLSLARVIFPPYSSKMSFDSSASAYWQGDVTALLSQ